VFYSVFTHTYPDETTLLLREARRLLADGGVIFADAFTSASPRRYSGGRDAVVLNRGHFLRLVAECGLRAEPVTCHPWGQDGQRLFFKFAPHQSTTAPSSASYSSRFFQS
jgi:hypothetical protein